MNKNNVDKQQAIRELWRRGILSWKCHSVQKEMYDLFYSAPKHSTLIWLLARQSGKSYLLAILALEQAFKKSNSIIKIVTDTKLHVKSIFEKIFLELMEDCPEDLKPEYKSNHYTYYCINGSQIQLAGTDNKHYEKLRGQKADLVLVDEAGFCNDLDDVVKSVLFPTTTHTGGKIILASTPPEESDHPFIKFIEEAEMTSTLSKKTIFDNPLLSEEQRQQIIDKMGGVNSERFRREYLCEIIKDPSLNVIPEFTPDLEKEIIKEWPKPPFFDTYEGMDLGGRDLTVVLFGYFDFRADKVIIEDEIVMNFSNPNENIEKLTKNIEEKEKILWFNPLTQETKYPYIRISDINYIVTNEILKYSNNKINFTPAKKDDNDAAINTLRVMIASKKIIIHPRCVNLIRHLRNVKWDNKNTNKTFARSPDDGHYDAVDALKYLVRHVIYTKNPYPAHYGVNMKDLHVQNPDRFYGSDPNNIYRKIFNIKPRRKSDGHV